MKNIIIILFALLISSCSLHEYHIYKITQHSGGKVQSVNVMKLKYIPSTRYGSVEIYDENRNLILVFQGDVKVELLK